jgi:hypothetical protein
MGWTMGFGTDDFRRRTIRHDDAMDRVVEWKREMDSHLLLDHNNPNQPITSKGRIQPPHRAIRQTIMSFLQASLHHVKAGKKQGEE